MPTDVELQEMLDKQRIYEVLCRYCRGVDRLDKELTLSCFHPGATDTHMGYGGKVYNGTIEDFLNGEWEIWQRLIAGSMHYIANFLCEIKGDVAVVETYQYSCTWGHGEDPELDITNSNRYIDKFERRDGEWKIAERELLRNFTRTETRPAEFPNSENHWQRSAHNRTDPAYRTP